jgi:diacylglycerol kinase family enzyme
MQPGAPAARYRRQHKESPSFMPAVSLSGETPLFVVFNAASGSGDAKLAHQQMREVLTAAKQPHEFLLIESSRQIAQLAQRAVEQAQRRNGAVVAAGGDGTINAVALAAHPAGLPFGIVPQGTFNYTGRAQGIPLDTVQATRALLNGRTRPMQVGYVNDRIFLVNASLGLYPELLQDREQDKARYGRKRVVALWSGLVSLSHQHRQLTLEIEHDREREVVRTPSLFVGNNPLQLENVGAFEADAIAKHRLAAVIVKPVGTLQLLGLALHGALGRLGEADSVREFAFRRMTVRPRTRSAQRPVKVALDGEILMMAPPLEFFVAPEPLWLITAVANAADSQ